jgi:hypothetical protein
MSGRLTKKNIRVIPSGPMMVHHHDGSAASPKTYKPHQKRISPK